MRFYAVDGKQYPSVTTVLSILRKPMLEQWRGRLGNEEADRTMNEAADLGREVHKILELIDLGKSITVKPELLPMVQGYLAWKERAVQEIVSVERFVCSRRYQYAGTTDRLAVLKGDRLPAVIDLKTSKSIYPDHGLQLSGYKGALTEEGVQTGRRLVVLVDKIERGKVKVKEFKDHDKEFRLFLYSLELWRHFNGGVLKSGGELNGSRTG